jgi:hypothetical protein
MVLDLDGLALLCDYYFSRHTGEWEQWYTRAEDCVKLACRGGFPKGFAGAHTCILAPHNLHTVQACVNYYSGKVDVFFLDRVGLVQFLLDKYWLSQAVPASNTSATELLQFIDLTNQLCLCVFPPVPNSHFVQWIASVHQDMQSSGHAGRRGKQQLIAENLTHQLLDTHS